jgi:hypothetical protein
MNQTNIAQGKVDSPAVEPQTAVSSPGLMSRFIGVLFSPRQTFAQVAKQPKWLGMLLIVIIVSAVATGGFLSTQVGQQAYMDEAVRRAEAAGGRMSDQQYQAVEKMLPYMGYITAGGIVVMAPLMTLVLGGILYMVFGAVLGGEGTFKQVFSVVAHCGAVSAVGQLFMLPLNFIRQSMSSATNLAVFFPMLDEGSFLARLLGSIDLFLVWWVMVLAIGMAVLYRRKTRPIAISFFAVYALIAVGIAVYYAVRSSS